MATFNVLLVCSRMSGPRINTIVRKVRVQANTRNEARSKAIAIGHSDAGTHEWKILECVDVNATVSLHDVTYSEYF